MYLHTVASHKQVDESGAFDTEQLSSLQVPLRTLQHFIAATSMFFYFPRVEPNIACELFSFRECMPVL